MSSPSIFSGVRLDPSYILLFVPLSFFFWPLYCLSFVNWRLLITSVFSSKFFIGLVLVLCVVLWCFVPVYLFLWPLCCVVYPSSAHGFWLPLWYLQTVLIVLKLWWFSNNQLVTLLDCSVTLQSTILIPKKILRHAMHTPEQSNWIS